MYQNKLNSMVVKSKGIPGQAEVALGIPGRFISKFGTTGRSSAICTDRLYLRRNPWYSFSKVESTSGHMVLSEGTTEKIPSNTTGNRSRDRPTSSLNHYATPCPYKAVSYIAIYSLDSYRYILFLSSFLILKFTRFKVVSS
jgi:hypothetical protein